MTILRKFWIYPHPEQAIINPLEPSHFGIFEVLLWWEAEQASQTSILLLPFCFWYLLNSAVGNLQACKMIQFRTLLSAILYSGVVSAFTSPFRTNVGTRSKSSLSMSAALIVQNKGGGHGELGKYLSQYLRRKWFLSAYALVSYEKDTNLQENSQPTPRLPQSPSFRTMLVTIKRSLSNPTQLTSRMLR